MLEALSGWVQLWAEVYADHPALSTAVLCVHVVAMFVGGGMAIGADRAILRAAPGTAEGVRAIIADLATVHGVVISALLVTMASGVALFLSDIDTFLVSKVLWVKMASLVLLLANGLRMRRVEHVILFPFQHAPVHTVEMPIVFPVRQWHALRWSAARSLALWLSIVVLGVILTNG